MLHLRGEEKYIPSKVKKTVFKGMKASRMSTKLPWKGEGNA